MSSCLRYAAKKDGNHRAIVIDLRRCGCSVLEIHRVGGGAPDLLVGAAGENYLLEVKPRGERARPDQLAWAENWRGRPPTVVHSTEEALYAVKKTR